MPEARVNGVRLNYRRLGAGADLVLVHGLAANQAFWPFEVVASLARAFRVTTFDLRGHGYSDMPPTGYRAADMAEDLAALLDHLGIGQAHLVGHSFGGVVALLLALGRPDRALSLVVADSRVRSLQCGQPLTEAPDWPAVRSALARCGVAVEEGEPEIALCLLEALAKPSWDAARRGLGGRSAFVPFGRAGKRSAARWLRLLATSSAREDFRVAPDVRAEQLASFGRPVLLLYGERSPNRPTCEALRAWLPRCEAFVVPGAGHFHPVSRPHFFRDAVLRFCGDAASRTAPDRAATAGPAPRRRWVQ